MMKFHKLTRNILENEKMLKNSECKAFFTSNLVVCKSHFIEILIILEQASRCEGGHEDADL